MNSYPPTFKQALVEFTNYVHTAQTDATIDKEKLCDGVQRRLSIIIGKFVSAPTGESFSIFTKEPQKPPPKDATISTKPCSPRKVQPLQGQPQSAECLPPRQSS